MTHYMGKGYQDIGKHRTEIGHDNRRDVFNAIRELSISDAKPKVRLEDIIKYLEKQTDLENENMMKIMTGIYQSGFKNWTRAHLDEVIRREKKKTISRRTIQRCIDNDPRIKKEGWYFFIDDEARFEKRYDLNIEDTGRILYGHFRSVMYDYHYEKLNHDKARSEYKMQCPIEEVRNIVTEMGFFLVYSLIEACKPFRDKSLSIDEREDLVKFWIKKWVPIIGHQEHKGMLEEFFELFNPYDSEQLRKEGLSNFEIDEAVPQSVTKLLAKAYPDCYKYMHMLELQWKHRSGKQEQLLRASKSKPNKELGS